MKCCNEDCLMDIADKMHHRIIPDCPDSRSCEKFVPPTNANHIRVMSNEELAIFLKAEMWNDFKPSCKQSTFFSADSKPTCDEGCVNCVLDWLKQPYTEENWVTRNNRL